MKLSNPQHYSFIPIWGSRKMGDEITLEQVKEARELLVKYLSSIDLYFDCKEDLTYNCHEKSKKVALYTALLNWESY